jgi:hypothetical protein
VHVQCKCPPPPPPPPPPKQCSEVLIDELCVDKFVPFCSVKELLPCLPDKCSVAVLQFEFGVVPGENNYYGFRIDGQLNERFQRHVCGAAIGAVLAMYLETSEKFVPVPLGYELRQDACFTLPFTGRGFLLVKTAFLAQLWRKIAECDCSEKKRKRILEALLHEIAPVILTITQIVAKPCNGPS